MVVALITLAHTHWYPLLDMAWTEMRLRDVWSSNPPLLGLAGRIGPFGHQGSHPGPLSFYVMWPAYSLFGGSAWSLEVASVFVHVVAIATVLWIAYRRGGVGLVLGMAAVLAVLLRGYGASLLTQGWNPYLPVVWWLVFLLSVWSVLCDDWLFLPVAVFAGSFCAQTEVSYLGLGVALGAVAVLVAGVVAYRRRHDPAVVRRFAGWLLAAVVVAVLVWLPPVVQQLTSARGNLGVLFNYFRNPLQPPAGLVQGVKVMLAHLNPVVVLTHALVPTTSHVDVTTGSVIPGSVFLVIWLATAAAAWRRRLAPLVWLHAVIAVALVVGVVSISRIFGILWYYLVLWAWGLDVLMVVAVGWTLVEVARGSVPPSTLRPVLTAGGVALVVLTVAMSALFAVEAGDTQVPTPRLSETLGALVSPTARALDEHVGVSDGRAGRYLVTFGDTAFLGSQAFGLMNELERRGFQVGAIAGYAGPVTPHRVLPTQDATAVIHLSVGTDIASWQGKADRAAGRLLRSTQPERASRVPAAACPDRQRATSRTPLGADPGRGRRPLRDHAGSAAVDTRPTAARSPLRPWPSGRRVHRANDGHVTRSKPPRPSAGRTERAPVRRRATDVRQVHPQRHCASPDRTSDGERSRHRTDPLAVPGSVTSP